MSDSLLVIIFFLEQHRGAAEDLARKLERCGFKAELWSPNRALPDDYLAIIAIPSISLPNASRVIELLPGVQDYDSAVIRRLVGYLYDRLQSSAEQGMDRRRRAIELPDESAAERGPTLGIKPSEPAPKPLPTAPRPTPVAPSPEPVRSAEELPQRPAAETTDIAQARFTAFLPRQAAVERWHSLLVYAHTPEMLDQIRSDAKRFAAELGGMPREVRDSHAAALKRGTLLTFTPQAEKVTFNPSSVTIAWWEDVHRLEFRFKAEAALANQAVNITITVSADPLIIAQLRGGLVFESPESAYAPSPFENEPVTTAPYRAEEIFVSYSHLDSEVAEACRNAYHALGYEVLMDVDKLRAGEQWNEGLKCLIERATIFQLFWSENSAKSEFCREEWRYALQTPRGRETNGVGFIRPVYWRKPMPTPPEELKHLHFAYVRLPRLNE